MPSVLILSRRRQQAPEQAWKSGRAVAAQLTPSDAWQSGAPVRVDLATADLWQTGQGMSVRARTADVPLPPVAALPPTPAGDHTHQPPVAYLITHEGLPHQAIKYTLGNSRANGDLRDRPTAQIDLLGQVDTPGEAVWVSVVASSLTGGGSYAQTYGPFTVVGSSQQRTVTGWVTSLSTADTTAADAEQEQGWAALTTEYLPWEIENDLTPYEQAVRQRQEALRQQHMKDLPCPVANLPDTRSVTVQSLIYWLIDQLGLPTVITAPLPYAGDRFYPTEYTGVILNGGQVVGTSYKVKGKKPIEALRDLLGRIGWTVKLSYGQVVIGPPAPLSSGLHESAGALEVPAELLTEVKIEYVNAAPAGGNFTTPRSVEITGARIRKWLDPLDPASGTSGSGGTSVQFADQPQTPEETFETVKDADYPWGPLTTEAPTGTGSYRLDSTTSGLKVKRGGLMRSETQQTDGYVRVRDGQTNEDGSDHYVDMWSAPREQRRMTYSYDDPRFPLALTRQAETVAAFAEPVGYVVSDSESNVTTKEWNEKGWLQRRVTVSRKIGEWSINTTSSDYQSGPGGVTTTTTFPIHVTETEIETWMPTRPGWWQHVITRITQDYWLMKEDGEPTGLMPRTKTEVLTHEETDQGPEMAPVSSVDGTSADGKNTPETACPETTPEGFPYDEPLTSTYATNGRGDPVTVDIPWATTIPTVYQESYLAAQGQRPARRTTYTAAVPIRAETGSVVKSFSISGAAGSVTATATIEEEL